MSSLPTAPSAVLLACGLLAFAALPSPLVGQQTRHALHLGGSPFGVSVDLPGYSAGEARTRPDGNAAMLEAEHPRSGMVVSVFLERGTGATGARECRDLYRERMRRSPLRMSEVRESKLDSLEVVRWMVREHEGQRVMLQNANAYYGGGGVCLDVHLSKVGYTAADSTRFDEVLRGIRIVAPPQPGPGDLQKRARLNAMAREVQRRGGEFLSALQRQGLEGIQSFLEPETSREQDLAETTARLRAAFAAQPLDSLELVYMESYELEGIEHMHLRYGRSSSERPAMILWFRRRGDEPFRVSSVLAFPPSGGAQIEIGPESFDWP